jgi:hypothetical protein
MHVERPQDRAGVWRVACGVLRQCGPMPWREQTITAVSGPHFGMIRPREASGAWWSAPASFSQSQVTPCLGNVDRVVTAVVGADTASRTPDLRITNALLYQLSYVG